MKPTRDRRMRQLARQVARCPRCPELVRNRTAPVFGAGPLSAKALIVGEAPGRQEDKLGQPFVGQAGRLLDELMNEAGLARTDVFLTNIIKCRPPGNRVPWRSEISNCAPYLWSQIALVRPRVICALGRVAIGALLHTDARLEALRAAIHEYEGVPVICSYHPAYVRRMPRVRRQAVSDLRRVRDWAMGIELVGPVSGEEEGETERGGVGEISTCGAARRSSPLSRGHGG